MIPTAYSSGGEVEHEVSLSPHTCRLSNKYLIQLFMIGGILFFVIQKKHGSEGRDNVARLFLELLCKPEFPF
jgi:hypothetical protein